MKFDATMFVLVLFSVTACIGLITQRLETKDWMMIAGMVFSFFFTKSLPERGQSRATDNPNITAPIEGQKGSA